MAQTHNATVLPLAQEAQEIAKAWESLHYRAKRFLDSNSDAAIDWGAGQKPAVINEDANGNIDGANFGRTQLANFIGSLNTFRKVGDGESLNDLGGDHLGNVNALSNV